MTYLEEYVRFLVAAVRFKRKVRVVFDCSNGTTGMVLHPLFDRHPLVEPIFLNDAVDGNFPAHGPDPLMSGAQDQLRKAVVRAKADLGIIFDGDGDRVFFVDDQGHSIDPNEAGYMLMEQFRGPYVVSAVSSWRLRRKTTYVSRVGHSFFKRLMRNKKANLGLEHSGHYYFKKFFYCDSGIFAAIQVLNFVSGVHVSLAQWLEKLPKYYRSGEINFSVKNKERALREFQRHYGLGAQRISTLDGVTIEYKDWWCNLRPSQTEPLIRLNIETTDQKILTSRVRELIAFLKQRAR